MKSIDRKRSGMMHPSHASRSRGAFQPALLMQTIDDELRNFNAVLKQERFDSLPHVVAVLTSRDPQVALRELRKQRDAIEDLVDDVVQGYHNGFNKAIHNYSQILRLFGQSAAHMTGLKTNLAEARRLLSARHKQLQQLWYRSITLRHVITLIDQIDGVAKVPARIEKLMAERKYYAAVQLLLHSQALLQREGMRAVGALKEVRNDLATLRQTLFTCVLDDLQQHLYNRGVHSSKEKATADKDADDDISTIIVAPVPALAAPHPSLLQAGLKIDKRPKPRSMRSTSDAGRSDGGFEDGEEEGPSTPATPLSVEPPRPLHSKLPSWLADSTVDGFTEAMMRSEAPPSVQYLHTLVEMVAMLGKVSSAGSFITQNLRSAVREGIIAEINTRGAAADQARPRVAGGKGRAGTVEHNPVYKAGMGAGVGLRDGALSLSSGPMQAAQMAAQELLEGVMQALIRILERHVVVGELMEAKAASHPHQEVHPVGGEGEGDPVVTLVTGGYSVAFAWACIQSEVQQLICDILRATSDGASGDDIVNRRIANGVSGNDTDLTFSFRFSDHAGGSEGVAGALGGKRGPALGQEGYGTAGVLLERGIYLTAACYRPVLQFTDQVCLLLPPKYSELGKHGLRPFMDSTVKDHFLPSVHVDYRNRCAHALAAPSAFRPKARSVGAYEASLERGRPVLQGPLAVEQVAGEVLLWAVAMPVYAGEFVSLVQTLLERTLDRCRAVYTEAVLGCLSAGVVGRSDLDELMHAQAAMGLLEERVLNEVEMKEAMEEPSAEREEEQSIFRILFGLRPLKEEQLMLDGGKTLLLAALSDTLDHMADSIFLLGQAQMGRGRKGQCCTPSQGALTSGLAGLSTRYRVLSRECLRTLRVEMQLQTLFFLQAMAHANYVTNSDAEEAEDFMVALTQQLARSDEEMVMFLPPARRCYVFGGVLQLAATALICSLGDIRAINSLGVRQVERNCIALQQTLATLDANHPFSVQHSLDRVTEYYNLLNRPLEALMAYIRDHERYYSWEEYVNLVRVHVPGREVQTDAEGRIRKMLNMGY